MVKSAGGAPSASPHSDAHDSALGMPRFPLTGVLLVFVLVAGVGIVGLSGCRSDKKASSRSPAQAQKPTLRIFTLGGAAGAIEPCGCVEDMLGGVDHVAALVQRRKKEAASGLVLGAGPMFFQDPKLPEDKVDQARLKAETMAASLEALGLVAWAPGANDWALGQESFRHLAHRSGAAPLATNLPNESGVQHGVQIVQRQGVRVGLVGVSVPRYRGGEVEFEIEPAEQALHRGLAQVKEQGAQIRVALIAAPRGKALRLVERMKGLTLAILGKPFDQGESNDEPFEPAIVGRTLTIQAPNHLQGVAVVDLFLRDEDFSFEDGSGIEQAQEKASLRRRIRKLSERIELWKKKESGVSEKEIADKEELLGRLQKRLAAFSSPRPPQEGSYFLYDLVLVKEELGQNLQVASRLMAYYKKVNERNRELFKDKEPPPVEKGQSSYVGVEQCTICHQEERAFWDGTSHAQAYRTLVQGHKQFNLDCVSCHVTGYGRPGGSTVTHVEQLKNVQCETCHGPGSRHISDPANRELIQRVPSQDLCTTCHHPPHVKEDWTVGAAWPHLIGPGHGM